MNERDFGIVHLWTGCLSHYSQSQIKTRICELVKRFYQPQLPLPSPYCDESKRMNRRAVVCPCDWLCRCQLLRRLVKTIVMGQVLSLLICGTAVSCQYLTDAKVETPMLQSFLNYALLLLIYTTILSTRKGQTTTHSRNVSLLLIPVGPIFLNMSFHLHCEN